MSDYFCRSCGSDEISVRLFVDLKTKMMDDTPAENIDMSSTFDNWCRNCEEHVHLTTDPNEWKAWIDPDKGEETFERKKGK